MLKLISEDSGARIGILKTKHGTVKTPFFMPIATKGSVKQLSPEELKFIGAEAIIANAFIIYLKPGIEVIKDFGSLHKFMGWDKTIFTDSGGFQILSKSFLHKHNKNGVYFKNPFNGIKEFLTPEGVIKIEEKVGGDVIMTLDFVPHFYGNDKSKIAEAMNTTHHWAERCLNVHKNKKQLLFGICQGGAFTDLREKSAKFINNLGFDGVALGGLCIGESRDSTFKNIKTCTRNIDHNKPRYLMGAGTPEEILEAVNLGIDCFDSRYPTMNARHGGIFTKHGKIDITKSIYKNDKKPLDEECRCYSCRNFSKAFIHHLYKTHEPIKDRYGNIHNLFFIQNLMKEIRKSIKNNYFMEFKKDFFKSYKIQKRGRFSYS